MLEPENHAADFPHWRKIFVFSVPSEDTVKAFEQVEDLVGELLTHFTHAREEVTIRTATDRNEMWTLITRYLQENDFIRAVYYWNNALPPHLQDFCVDAQAVPLVGAVSWETLDQVQYPSLEYTPTVVIYGSPGNPTNQHFIAANAPINVITITAENRNQNPQTPQRTLGINWANLITFDVLPVWIKERIQQRQEVLEQADRAQHELEERLDL